MALRLVAPTTPAFVEVPAELLELALDSAAGVAEDLLAGIDAVEHRIWAGSRAGALNELGRMAIRVEALREAFAALDPLSHQGRRPA